MDLGLLSGISSGAADHQAELEAQALVPLDPTKLDTLLKTLKDIRPEDMESDVVQTIVERLDEVRAVHVMYQKPVSDDAQ